MALSYILNVIKSIIIFLLARKIFIGFDIFTFLGRLQKLCIGTSLKGYVTIITFFNNLNLIINLYFLFLSNSIFANVIIEYISGTYTLY